MHCTKSLSGILSSNALYPYHECDRESLVFVYITLSITLVYLLRMVNKIKQSIVQWFQCREFSIILHKMLSRIHKKRASCIYMSACDSVVLCYSLGYCHTRMLCCKPHGIILSHIMMQLQGFDF